MASKCLMDQVDLRCSCWKKGSKGIEKWHTAALNGHLSEVKWLLEEEYAWTSRTTWYAVKGGQLALLEELLHKEGCPWDAERVPMQH